MTARDRAMRLTRPRFLQPRMLVPSITLSTNGHPLGCTCPLCLISPAVPEATGDLVSAVVSMEAEGRSILAKPTSNERSARRLAD